MFTFYIVKQQSCIRQWTTHFPSPKSQPSCCCVSISKLFLLVMNHDYLIGLTVHRRIPPSSIADKKRFSEKAVEQQKQTLLEVKPETPISCPALR